MLDITLRSLSLLVYLFLISYFFSNWSTAIKSHREFYNVIWIVIIISAMVTIILSNAYIPNIYLPYLNLHYCYATLGPLYRLGRMDNDTYINKFNL